MFTIWRLDPSQLSQLTVTESARIGQSVPVISLEEARQRVLDQCSRLHPKALPVSEVLGCVTSVPLDAPEAVPPFDNSAVDGFAVRADDVAKVPVQLRVVGTLAAGTAPTIPVGPGEAVRIMTGAPIPPGADAIVMVEDTSIDGEQVTIGRAVHRGDAVRRVGEDVLSGELVLDRFTPLGAAHLGVLASLGYRRVPVFPRARVGVLSTGDELVDDGSALQPGQIRESNRTMLLGALAQANCVPVDLGLARDTRAEITAALERGVLECDAIITSGGVSMGDFDLVKQILGERAEMNWMQITIRPAKPFAFGLLPGPVPEQPVPVFGLPGNPVSSLVSFELLARPALRQMMGHSQIDRPEVLGIADRGLARRADGKIHFVRVVGRFGPDGRLHVESTGAQGSHQLASTAAANGLAVLPDGPGVEAGGDVRVMLLGLER
jgi:molybdenum cofactor synthesis domain-containing protein